MLASYWLVCLHTILAGVFEFCFYQCSVMHYLECTLDCCVVSRTTVSGAPGMVLPSYPTNLAMHAYPYMLAAGQYMMPQVRLFVYVCVCMCVLFGACVCEYVRVYLLVRACVNTYVCTCWCVRA